MRRATNYALTLLTLAACACAGLAITTLLMHRT